MGIFLMKNQKKQGGANVEYCKKNFTKSGFKKNRGQVHYRGGRKG